MNIYTLSNTNVDSIKYYFSQDLRVVGSCTYGNYLIDLVDESSDLYRNNIDLVVLLIDGDELKITNDLQEIFSSVSNFLVKRKCLFLFSTISLRPYYVDTFLNISNEFEFNANYQIIKFCKENKSVFSLDIHKLIARLGSDKCLDDKFWYIGRIKYKPLFFKELAKEVYGVLHAINTVPKKVLVLDLDNTIWGGIVGEDGDNIQISNEGIGKIYSEFQKSIKYLNETGVLLSINSKNNYEDAVSGLSHKNSILSKSDFVLIKANWNNKVKNILEISDELMLGIDSFVFIDDNPVEREMVRISLPEVAVPEPPKDLNLYNQWFVSHVVSRYFSRVSLTKGDLYKTEQYKANFKRDSLKSEIFDVDLFIESLDIEINISIDDINNVERLSQLTQKTNQFNLTTHRYNINEVMKFITSKDSYVYSLDYKDKFKNEGVVGMAIVKIVEKIATIDVFLLSCRILNRKIEYSFLEEICKHLLSANVDTIIGNYHPTKKNHIANFFYSDAGFMQDSEKTFIKEV
jgi:FkbH-like protein